MRMFIVYTKCYITFKYQIFSLICCVFCFNRIRLEDFKDNRPILGQVINYVDTDNEGKWKLFNMNNI
jgi:predicted signal transduction protein with EAL and GGDEF domain